MGRKATFYEFTATTKAKWERIARLVAALAHYVSGGDNEKEWTKDEVIGHIHTVMEAEGNELDERREEMYLERMRMASVFIGPGTPTLDLVQTDENGFAYKWIRDGEIPVGFLRHVLSIAGAMPRLAFDYFILLAREDEDGNNYEFDELIDALGSVKAMTLLLLAELYVRVHRAEEIDADRFEAYLNAISEFKAKVQASLTRSEAKNFNAMATGLLLGAGE